MFGIGEQEKIAFVVISVIVIVVFLYKIYKNTSKEEKQSQKGQDIHQDLIITEEESLVGTEKTITFPEGNQTIKIPPGINYSGKVLKFSGKGYPRLNGGKNGDVYIKIILDTKSNLKTETNNGV